MTLSVADNEGQPPCASKRSPSARIRLRTSTSSSRCRSAASRSSMRWTRRPARCSSTASCTPRCAIPAITASCRTRCRATAIRSTCWSATRARWCPAASSMCGRSACWSWRTMPARTRRSSPCRRRSSPSATKRCSTTPTCRGITLDQVAHFFEHYKDLEPGKWVKIAGWHDAARARQMIVEAIERGKTG